MTGYEWSMNHLWIMGVWMVYEHFMNESKFINYEQQFSSAFIVNFGHAIISCSPTIMFLIFWDFLMIDQIFISPHMKRAWLVINMVYTSCLMSCRATSEDLRKLGNIRKISELYGFISSCTVVLPIWKFCQY